ncbi:Light-inducible protein CPRF2 [Capsicum chinense]|nr:Light-inducible protein CPRF2 [Capsicum chinense]
MWKLEGWNITFRRQFNDWEIARVAEFFNIIGQFNGTQEGEDSYGGRAVRKVLSRCCGNIVTLSLTIFLIGKLSLSLHPQFLYIRTRKTPFTGYVSTCVYSSSGRRRVKEVSQVRVENSSLLKRLTDISQKHNEAAVDNRVLKADVETLRAKVKMAEETVKRVTGLNPLFQAMTEISTIMLPSFTGSPFDSSADAGVPEQDDLKCHYYPAPDNSHMPNHDSRMQNAMLDIPPIGNVHQNSATEAIEANKIGRTSSMQRVASLEHLQKHIRGDPKVLVEPKAGENNRVT